MTHTVLPESAQAMLMRAATTPNTEDDPLAKLKAVNAAISAVRRKYPQHFRLGADPTARAADGTYAIPKFLSA